MTLTKLWPSVFTTVIVAITAAIVGGGTAWALMNGAQPVAYTTGSLMLTDGPPANHESIIFGASWDHLVQHSETGAVDCLSDAAIDTSQCRLVARVKAPRGATHAVLKLKTKAWVLGGEPEGGLNYGLIYVRAPAPHGIANHFAHTEQWGGGANGQDQRRRVEYDDVTVPLIDGTVTLEIGKQVSGNAMVEIAVYLVGFVASPPLTSQLY